jgi:hypothetical protein
VVEETGMVGSEDGHSTSIGGSKDGVVAEGDNTLNSNRGSDDATTVYEDMQLDHADLDDDVVNETDCDEDDCSNVPTPEDLFKALSDDSEGGATGTDCQIPPVLISEIRDWLAQQVTFIYNNNNL